MATREQWGNITWALFHILAEKINENKFFEVKNKLVKIIIGICGNLPCPDCSDDAVRILKQAYVRNIKTKNHFIEFMRQFHNIVNIKLHKRQVSILELQNLYKNSNINSIIQQFFTIYRIKSYNPKMIPHSLQSIRYLSQLNNELNEIKYAYC